MKIQRQFIRNGITRFAWAGLILTAVVVSGCSTPKGDTVAERREYVLETRDATLAKAFEFQPELRSEIQTAPGYAVFSNIGAQILLLGGGQGFGVVVDNRTGSETFMNMASAGIGFGLGVKDFRAIFVFDDPEVMARFIESGWQFGAEADAAAIARGETGVAAGVDASATPAGSGAVGASGAAGAGSETSRAQAGSGSGMRIYQITENGLALQARISGTRYWPSRELN